MKKTLKQANIYASQKKLKEKPILYSNNPLSLEQFSSDLTNLQQKNRNISRKNKYKKQKLERLQKLQKYIKLANILVKESSPQVQQPSIINCPPPIYYCYSPQSLSIRNSAFLPQINCRTQRESSCQLGNEFETMRKMSSRKSLNSDQQSDSTHRIIKKTAKIKQHKKGNRLRICGIAVYFCLLFPKFSQKFKQIRYKWFKDRYRSPACLKEHGLAIHNKLQQIRWERIYSTCKESPNNSANPTITFLGGLLAEVFTKLSNKLTLKYHHQVLGVGALNKHFYLHYQHDYMYFPEELEIVDVRVKGRLEELCIGAEMEVMLVVIRVMFKIVIYDYLRPICQGQPKHNINAHQDQPANQDALQMIKVCTVFLHQVCSDMYKLSLSQHRANQPSSPGIPDFGTSKSGTINLLTTNSLFRTQTITSMLDNSNSNNNKQYNPDNPFPYLESMKGYDRLLGKVGQSRLLAEFRQEAVDRVLDIAVAIRVYLKQEERSLYKFIWDLALQQQGLLTYQYSRLNNLKITLETSRSNFGMRRKINHRRYRSQNDQQIQQEYRLQSRGPLFISPDSKQKSILKTTQVFKSRKTQGQ